MPLTPEDVSNKRFSPVRLREGYDMVEVDQFLDEVEAELHRLLQEGDDLRAELATATGGAARPATASPPKADKAAAKGTDKGDRSDEVSLDKPSDATPPQETIKVVTASEASSAAVRLLELATRNADEVVAEAKEEAEQILGQARTEAERLQAETKTRTETVEEEARTRAQNLETETDTKRRELLGDMENERARLDGEVENLRAFEREYRSRLKSYFLEQLQAIDGTGDGGELPEPGDAEEPKRLRSILGDRAGQSEVTRNGDQASATDTPDENAPQA